MSGLLKESNPWAPTLDVTIPLEVGAAVDVRPQAFVDSDVPPFVVTQQPANGSVTVDGDGLLLITLSQAGEDEARYTVANVGGAVSAPAILRLTGVSQEPGPAPDPQALSINNPFNATSAHHRRIGSGAEHRTPAEMGAPSNLFTSWIGGGTVNDNRFGGFVRQAASGDPFRNYSWDGTNNGSSGFPADLRTPSNFPGWPTGTENGDRVAVLVEPNGTTAHEFFWLNQTVRAPNFQAAIRRQYEISGVGHPTTANGGRVGTSASGASIMMGAVRKFELETPGLAITHSHNLAVPRREDHNGIKFLDDRLQWPAGYGDAGAATANVGSLPYGTLLAIPTIANGGPNLENLLSAGTISEMWYRFLVSVRNYGIYIIDGAVNPVFRADDVLSSGIRTQFLDGMRNQFWQYLSIVGNSVTNATATINTSNVTVGSVGTPNGGDIAGGGTPLAPNTAFDA